MSEIAGLPSVASGFPSAVLSVVSGFSRTVVAVSNPSEYANPPIGNSESHKCRSARINGGLS